MSYQIIDHIALFCESIYILVYICYGLIEKDIRIRVIIIIKLA